MMIYNNSSSATATIPWGNYGNYKDNNITTNSDWRLFDYNGTSTSNSVNFKEYVVDVSKSLWCSDNYECDNTWVFSGNLTLTKSPQERLREMIQSRQAPAIHCSRKALNPVASIEEMRARDMLRRVIGHDKFRDFMRNGFLSVMAKSGKVYQIFPGQDFTNVFLNGEKIEKLCVVLRGKFPPTDSLIMRYLLILNDEQDFRSYAIQHRVYPSGVVRATLPAEPMKSLPELFRGLKVA